MTDQTATDAALATAPPADHTATAEHTAHAFDTDLQELRRKVTEMGDLAMKQIVDTVRALLERDTELAERVLATDPRIDAMRHEIEQKAVLTIARRQPVAVDLREIIAAMRMCNDLERVGDHAKHIAKRVIALRGDLYPLAFARGVEHMGNLVLSSLKKILDAYTSHDLQAAIAVWTDDEDVDALCILRFRELLTYMMEDPHNITFCMHLMFCANDLERIGDHATNIAETVYYMIDGGEISEERPKGDLMNFRLAPVQRKI